MHDEDAKFEDAIKNMKAAIAGINWSLLANNRHAGENHPDVRRPMAYAMFESLVDDLACDKHGEWCDFLQGALQEVTLRYLAGHGTEFRTIRPWDTMTFGVAIEMLKHGKRVARAGWNGRGMWLHLAENYPEAERKDFVFYDDKDSEYAYQSLPWIGMKTADSKFVPWLASQTDMLADDWRVVDGFDSEPSWSEG
jgi:hypothetical protein